MGARDACCTGWLLRWGSSPQALVQRGMSQQAGGAPGLAGRRRLAGGEAPHPNTRTCAKGLSEQRGAHWSEPRWRLDVRCLCAEWWKCVKGTKQGGALLFLSVNAAKDAFCTNKCPSLCSEGRVEAEHSFCNSLLEEVLVSAGAALFQGRRRCRGVWGARSWVRWTPQVVQHG